MLPVAKDYGNKLFDENWTFQQDGTRVHTSVVTTMVLWQFSEFYSQRALATQQP